MTGAWLGRAARFVYSSEKNHYQGTVLSRAKSGPEVIRSLTWGCREYDSECDDVLVEAEGAVYVGQIPQGDFPEIREGSMLRLTETKENFLGLRSTDLTAGSGNDEWFYLRPDSTKHAMKGNISLI